MELLYKIPAWFTGYDGIIQIFFATVCLLVALYAFKLYAVSKQRDIKLFSISFILIGVSYAAWPIIDFLGKSNLNHRTIGIFFENKDVASVFSIYVHVLFFIAGLVTLVYMSLKKQNLKLYFLLLLLTIIPVIVTIKKTNMVYSISSILIFFILVHYYSIYTKKSNNQILIVFLAFFLLFLASLDLIFSDDENFYYVGGHFLMLISYFLILGRLAVSYRKWQKKEIN